MEKILIKLNRQCLSYPIYIGKNLLGNIVGLINLNGYSQVMVLTDNVVAGFWLKKITRAVGKNAVVAVIKNGEAEKNIDTVRTIWKKMVQSKLDRRSVVVNLGGGVVCDLGGFCAGTYMRGIDFVNIPTTLLSQVDAGIGGKTGLNFFGIKNNIGIFNQPKAVLTDVVFLSTLPERELISGMAEVIKHGIVADKKYFESVVGKKPVDFSSKELIEIVKKSCLIKTAIMEKDEKEMLGKRKILNFGHTVGHAIESLSQATDRPLLHGEAVGIGMVIESKLACLSGLLKEKDYLRIKDAIKNAGLPITTPHIPVKKIIKKILVDKKNQSGRVLWSLPTAIGQVECNKEILSVNKMVKIAYENN